MFVFLLSVQNFIYKSGQFRNSIVKMFMSNIIKFKVRFIIKATKDIFLQKKHKLIAIFLTDLSLNDYFTGLKNTIPDLI